MPGLEPWFPQFDYRRYRDDGPTPVSSDAPSAAPSDARAWPMERAADAMAAFDGETDGREALPPPPNDPEIIGHLIKNALLLIDGGETRLAMNLLRNALMRDSKHAEALRWMAYCLKHLGRHQDAAKCARALCKERPKEDASWFLLGEIFYDLERDDEARRCFEQALRLARPECPFLFDLYKFLGNVHVRGGDFDAAEDAYNRAFAVNPNSDALLVNYGTLEIQRSNWEASAERFRGAVALNAQNDKAWVGLALVHRQMGDRALSWANLERAAELQPQNRTAVRLALDWGAQERSFEAAIRLTQAYLAAETDDAEISFALAKIFAWSRRLEDARTEMERALSLEPRLEGAAEFFDALRAEMAENRGQSRAPNQSRGESAP